MFECVKVLQIPLVTCLHTNTYLRCHILAACGVLDAHGVLCPNMVGGSIQHSAWRCQRRYVWLVAWSVPSHYLNQCWNIVNWTLRNKLQWNSKIEILKFSFKKMHLKVLCAKWRPFGLSVQVLNFFVFHWVHLILRADSRFAPSQWETLLLCDDVSHWLGASLESAMIIVCLWELVIVWLSMHYTFEHIFNTWGVHSSSKMSNYVFDLR